MRWVDENAFAPIVRARPCPTFGRPVRLRGGPHRLRPGTSPHALRIPPRGGHPALRSLTKDGCRSALAVSGFRLRARLGISIPPFFSGQRGITPAFGYGDPHPSAGGTPTLLTNTLPSAHYEPLRHPLDPGTHGVCRAGYPRDQPSGLPVLLVVPCWHAVTHHPGEAGQTCRPAFRPTRASLPPDQAGSAFAS